MNKRIEEDIQKICDIMGMDRETIFDKTSKKEYVETRHIIIYVLSKKYEIGWTKMGEMIGRNHSTCIHGFNNIVDLLEINQLTEKQARALNLVFTETQNSINADKFLSTIINYGNRLNRRIMEKEEGIRYNKDKGNDFQVFGLQKEKTLLSNLLYLLEDEFKKQIKKG